jgi:hypothetical protein
MKKYLWVLVLALAVSSLSVGPVAADGSNAKQDQAFLTELSQQSAVVTGCAASTDRSSLGAVVTNVVCTNVPCTKASDCYAYCGGQGSNYCNWSTHRCVPF